MKLIATDGPIDYGRHHVQLSSKELLILEMALCEARLHFASDDAAHPAERSTLALWTENRQLVGGIHESYIAEAKNDITHLISKIGLK